MPKAFDNVEKLLQPAVLVDPRSCPGPAAKFFAVIRQDREGASGSVQLLEIQLQLRDSPDRHQLATALVDRA